MEVCLESSHPRPAVNIMGLIHSTLSLLGRRCPKERAKPHTTGSPYLLPEEEEEEGKERIVMKEDDKEEEEEEEEEDEEDGGGRRRNN